MNHPKPVVLIHGAYHGGWCWRPLARLLRAQGHEVFTPTLTGLGERAHLAGPQVDLDTHIADIAGVIEAEELTDLVLVGHSYGGMPVAGAADRLAGRISGLLFLDAFTPEDGDSAVSLRDAFPGQAPRTVAEDGFSILPPKAAKFGLDGPLAAWVDRRLTPHPLATQTQPIRLTGAWRQVPRKVYLRMSAYPAGYFDRCYETAAADPDWIATRRDGSHDVMLTDPAWLAGILTRHLLG